MAKMLPDATTPSTREKHEKREPLEKRDKVVTLEWQKSGRLETWATHQYASEALRRVLAVFERGGVEALPVKGIVLAHALYGDVSERPIADVDLRVRPRDLARVVRLARGEGWPVCRNSKQLGSRGIEVCRTLVEVETTIGPPGLCALGVDELLRRSQESVGRLGFLHREPEIHDHVLQLCVNAFKDKLVALPPWSREDLVRVVVAPGFDPKVMADRAREGRVESIVWIVAEWMEKVSSTKADAAEAWSAVRDRVGRLAPRPGYARAYKALADTEHAFGWALAALARAGSDDVARRVQALVLGGVGTLLYELDGARRDFGKRPSATVDSASQAGAPKTPSVH